MPRKINQENKIFLGIDPGLADTGYGVVRKTSKGLEMVAYGSIKTSKDLDLPARLKTIDSGLTKIIKKYHPDVAGIEKLFFCRNVTTAMAVGQARGVALLTLTEAGLPIIELTPLQIKLGVTGHGQADKKQVQMMVKILLNLKKIPQPDDAADGLAIAICADGYYRHQKLGK